MINFCVSLLGVIELVMITELCKSVLFFFPVLVCEIGKKAKLKHGRSQLDKKGKAKESVTVH